MIHFSLWSCCENQKCDHGYEMQAMMTCASGGSIRDKYFYHFCYNTTLSSLRKHAFCASNLLEMVPVFCAHRQLEVECWGRIGLY